MNYFIRDYTSKDWNLLLDMVMALYSEDPEGEPMDGDKLARTVRHLEEFPQNGRVVILQAGDEPAGYGILLRLWSNEYGGDILWIDELYVRPRHRGVGLGRRFMEYAAALPDIRALSLAVTPANQRAYSWYRSLGFSPETNRILSKALGRCGDEATTNCPGS